MEVVDVKEYYFEKQNELLKKIDLTNKVDISRIKSVAGVDLAYWNKTEEHAVCCIVVLDYESHEIIEECYCVDEINVPYIPGYLAFREIPLFIKTYSKLNNNPDIFFFDGNGYLHPRHLGLATHAGILIDKPTIGIAKSYYKINGVDFEMPAYEHNSYTDIMINEEVYGRALRTHDGVKPIFLSIGNQIDIDTAMEITFNLVTKESHIPLPTRIADMKSRKIKSSHLI